MKEGGLRFIGMSREKDEDEYSLLAKERLREIFSKRIETTMIGALSTIENYFGFFWSDDTPKDNEMYQLYKKVRKEILDRGNDQIKMIDRDLQDYHINYNKYVYKFGKENKDGK